ncbi:SRPBCC domain-containing protein [Kitasatospora sp. NPDC096077]|uniref:SRPBCC domain-containing protein n=1 Tax=Kitasatospora sp. NPDC096077 TaxID=3155544 RepID=UPI0033329747
MTLPEIKWERTLERSRTDIWNLMFDAEAARTWLGVAGYVMPEQQGAAFCWLFDTGSPKPTAFTGRLTTIKPQQHIEMQWELASCAADTRLIWEFHETGEERTTVVLRHADFPDSGLGPFEHDGYAHHWGHILDGLQAYANGEPRDTLHRHGAMLGLIPVGAAPDHGLLVKEIIRDSPAEHAGLRPGDYIRSANDTVIRCFDDWDDWIDQRVPGETVRLQLADRVIEVVLGEWRR